MLDDYAGVDLGQDQSHIFLSQVEQSDKLQALLKKIGEVQNLEERVKTLEETQTSFGDLKSTKIDAVLPLALAYRSAKAYQHMIDLFEACSATVRENVIVRQQLGFALNRVGRRAEARDELERLIESQGPSGETYGILGRVYKDMHDQACDEGDELSAEGHLGRAIDTYLAGYHAEPLNYFPGINALTYSFKRGRQEDFDLISELLPVVEFSLKRAGGQGSGDMWVVATMVEAAVLGKDFKKAKSCLATLVSLAGNNIFALEALCNNLSTYPDSFRAAATRDPHAADEAQKIVDMLKKRLP